MWVRVHVHACEVRGQPQVMFLKCQKLSALFFKTKSPSGLELTQQVRLVHH